MKHRIAVLVSLFAALIVMPPLSVQPADAFFRHKKVDPRVSDVSLVASILSTIGYFAIRNDHHHGGGVSWGAWGVTTVACMGGAPIFAAALVRERELTSREVMVMEGSCLVPIVGGWLVNSLYDANPQWERKPAKVAVRKKKKS